MFHELARQGVASLLVERGDFCSGTSAAPSRNAVFVQSAAARGWYGPKGDASSLPALSGASRFSTATKTEFNSEPIRLTFDASKAFIGPKYSHFVHLWVAYRYWQNKFGLDHNATPGVCTITATGQSTNT